MSLSPFLHRIPDTEMMPTTMQRRGAGDVPFSADADTEDYYAFLPSDESMSDVEDAAEAPKPPKADTIEELSATFASSSISSVLTPIRSLHGRPTRQREVKTPSPGVSSQGGEEFRLSPRALEQHEARRSKLEEALDAAVGSIGGEAPFRFRRDEEMQTVKAEAGGEAEKVEDNAMASYSDSEGEVFEPDPLYDEQLDDADEKWVATNLRDQRPTTDATLCCPCCFVTVCMVCERHATFTNQYRASKALNCRVKKDEILTYTTEGKVPASLPFQKRQNLVSSSKSLTTGQHIARLLREDEFYPVACSDCGTMVGVFDRDQQYHFFNALPSNC